MSLLTRVTVAMIALILPGHASAAWHEAKSRHFIIYADLKAESLKEYAERLERFDQAVRLVRGMDDPKLTDAQRLTVYVLRSEDAVARLAGMGMASGFYRPSAAGSAAFVPRKAGSKYSDGDLDAEAIFFHEYAHHLQLESSSLALPLWVTEGFAEFFATAKIEKDGSVAIGAPPQYRSYGLFHETGLPLEQLVGATYAKLDSGEVDRLYGLGWLLTHYLTFEPSRKGQLARYVDDIQKGMGPLDAAKAAFGDLRALNREVEKYKRGKLNGLRVDGNALSIGNIAVRPMTAGEAAIMNIHIRSRGGVNDKSAPGVAADARSASAPFLNDPFVQAALAEAEFDSRNYAAAEAAADRALAANPNYVRALIYKGRARMELARTKPGADWKEIRGWFAKANRLDTENAEVLMLFYQSYGNSGAAPTKNAVDGLLYAVALVPQDNGLRINAVLQLIVENRLPEARDLFAPLAFQPHAPERYRKSNAEIMAALAAGDRKHALAMLTAAMEPSTGEAKKP